MTGGSGQFKAKPSRSAPPAPTRSRCSRCWTAWVSPARRPQTPKRRPRRFFNIEPLAPACRAPTAIVLKHPDQLPGRAVGQHVQPTVPALADVADALAQIFQQAVFSHHPVVLSSIRPGYWSFSAPTNRLPRQAGRSGRCSGTPCPTARWASSDAAAPPNQRLLAPLAHRRAIVVQAKAHQRPAVVAARRRAVDLVAPIRPCSCVHSACRPAPAWHLHVAVARAQISGKAPAGGATSRLSAGGVAVLPTHDLARVVVQPLGVVV